MTLLEWRRNPERRSLVIDLLANPTLREMLSILELVEHPAKQHHALADGFAATLVLGQVQGWQQCLDAIRSFAEPLPSPMEDVETTWGVDLPDPNQK